MSDLSDKQDPIKTLADTHLKHFLLHPISVDAKIATPKNIEGCKAESCFPILNSKKYWTFCNSFIYGEEEAVKMLEEEENINEMKAAADVVSNNKYDDDDTDTSYLMEIIHDFSMKSNLSIEDSIYAWDIYNYLKDTDFILDANNDSTISCMYNYVDSIHFMIYIIEECIQYCDNVIEIIQLERIKNKLETLSNCIIKKKTEEKVC